MIDDLAALFRFNRWADGRVLKALEPLSFEQYIAEPVAGWSSIRATLAHLADAADIWSRRLSGETVTARSTEIEVPTLEAAAGLLRKGHDALDRWLEARSLEELKSLFTYQDLRGATWSLPTWAVARHVVNHATYHRGQIASKLGRLGFEPPGTDLVLWASGRS